MRREFSSSGKEIVKFRHVDSRISLLIQIKPSIFGTNDLGNRLSDFLILSSTVYSHWQSKTFTLLHQSLSLMRVRGLQPFKSLVLSRNAGDEKLKFINPNSRLMINRSWVDYSSDKNRYNTGCLKNYILWNVQSINMSHKSPRPLVWKCFYKSHNTRSVWQPRSHEFIPIEDLSSICRNIWYK